MNYSSNMIIFVRLSLIYMNHSSDLPAIDSFIAIVHGPIPTNHRHLHEVILSVGSTRALMEQLMVFDDQGRAYKVHSKRMEACCYLSKI